MEIKHKLKKSEPNHKWFSKVVRDFLNKHGLLPNYPLRGRKSTFKIYDSDQNEYTAELDYTGRLWCKEWYNRFANLSEGDEIIVKVQKRKTLIYPLNKTNIIDKKRKAFGIGGEILCSEKALKSNAYKKRNDYIEITIPHNLLTEYKNKGWELVKKNKYSTRIKKEKSPTVLFEDKVWMTFYNLGFHTMNKDNNCKLQFGTYSKKIDVLAKDNENVFIVECKSAENEDPINAKDPLEEYAGKRDHIIKAVQASFGRNCGRINIVIVIASQNKRERDCLYVENNRDKCIFLWSAKEIQYINNLIQQVGHTAKYQMYSVIFSGRKQKSLSFECPAIKGRIGGNVFYTFMISAKQLIKYAYIHHRNLTEIIETSKVYQRMLRGSKLKEIAKFIDKEGGYFPNSIIVNFLKPLQWNKTKKFGEDLAIGTLEFPNYYGSAWVIDGQHRLYGAAKATNDLLLPVLAFQEISTRDQADLFVEINEKQTPVPKNLLWDLYSDIYLDTEDPKLKIKYQIAETAKLMESDGPLSSLIDIPSVIKDRPVKLSLTTICSTLEKYSPWDHLKHRDDSKTPQNASRIINIYFEALKSLWPEDWKKGKKGVILTNNAFGIFIMLFDGIANHIGYRRRVDLFGAQKGNELKKELMNKYLKPIIEWLKANEDWQTDIRKAGGRGKQSDIAGDLETKLQEHIPDYYSPRIGDEVPIPKDKKPDAIVKIIEKANTAEPSLRKFVLTRLKRFYGSEKWWKQAIPVDLKGKLDDMWTKEIKRKGAHIKKTVKKPNEWKFEHLGLGELMKIITLSKNWDGTFKQVFEDKLNFERRIKDIMVLRNPTVHKRTHDDQDVADGQSGLLYLSLCINDPDLNPYV